MRVIKENGIIEDGWTLLRQDDINEDLPAGDIIVPFSVWKAQQQRFQEHAGKIGVSIRGDDVAEEVAAHMEQFDLIALEFPEFKDGRLYSHARLLRERYTYEGELRAVGDVLRDQLFYMQRCGIDSFQVREDKDIEDAINGLSDFSFTYQSAADGRLPISKQR